MKGIDILVEVPCFKCLLWNPIMESHLHCNPGECEELTKWILKETNAEDASKLEQSSVEVQIVCDAKKTAKRLTAKH